MYKPYQPNKSIISTVECLNVISELGRSVSAGELARILDKDYTHTHRILRTLLHTGILNKTADNKYIAGYGLYMLSAQSLYHSGLLSKSIKILHSYVQKNIIIALGIFFRDMVWYLIHTKPGGDPVQPQDIRMYPAQQSTIATCLSAFINKENLVNYFKTKAMQREQSKILKQGYYFSITEFSEHSIAFPIAPIQISQDIDTLNSPSKQKLLKNISPIAGIAFVDNVKSLSEEQMWHKYSSAALKLCSQLY